MNLRADGTVAVTALPTTVPGAGSSVEKLTDKQGPAAATAIWDSTGGETSSAAAVSKMPTTPAGSGCPAPSRLPEPRAIEQAAPAGSGPPTATR